MDDSLKSLITEAIVAALSTTMADMNKTIMEQVNKSIAAMNSSINEMCVRQDFLNSKLQRLSRETSASTTINHNNNPRLNWIAKIDFSKFYGMFLLNVEALLKRFYSTYENPMSDLKNIRQKGGLVQVYIDAFDLLMTKEEVLETQAIGFFLGGLDKEIEISVRMFRPQTLADAYCLSKLQEANNIVSKKLTWKLEGETLKADVMLIPLGGYEMGLGMQWLATLGDIVYNFLKLIMEFMYQERKVAIKGAPQPALRCM
ncbi:hypothetical protein Tco_0768655 [Tanacetum coccineum]